MVVRGMRNPGRRLGILTCVVRLLQNSEPHLGMSGKQSTREDGAGGSKFDEGVREELENFIGVVRGDGRGPAAGVRSPSG